MLARINQQIKRTDAYRRYKNSLTYVTLNKWQKLIRRKVNLSKYRGTRYVCPVCGMHLNEFKPIGRSYVRMTQTHGFIYPLSSLETFNTTAYYCPSCDALDRERLYALYLEKVFPSLDQDRRYRLLEFAPSPGLQKKLKSCRFLTYRSADLFRTNVDDQIDIADMGIYSDGSVDIILCSHVLEHVPDDRQAIKELHRVLSNDGFGIVLVPLVHGVDETHEQVIDVPELRWKYYGSDDHVRQYGKRDFVDRLVAAGFQVEQVGIECFEQGAFERAGIAEDSVLYLIRKAAAPAANASSQRP